MLRLNLGAGDRRIAGWTAVDLRNADVNHNLDLMPWPFADATADHVLASHILEHFDRSRGEQFLTECRRVLRPGGRLSLAVPDLDRFADCIVSGDWAPLNGYAHRDLNAFAGGGPGVEPRPEWRHRYIYCWRSLAHLLAELRFKRIERRYEPAEFDTPEYAAISLYVDAVVGK